MIKSHDQRTGLGTAQLCGFVGRWRSSLAIDAVLIVAAAHCRRCVRYAAPGREWLVLLSCSRFPSRDREGAVAARKVSIMNPFILIWASCVESAAGTPTKIARTQPQSWLPWLACLLVQPAGSTKIAWLYAGLLRLEFIAETQGGGNCRLKISNCKFGRGDQSDCFNLNFAFCILKSAIRRTAMAHLQSTPALQKSVFARQITSGTQSLQAGGVKVS
jgi:hypothetical protein